MSREIFSRAIANIRESYGAFKRSRDKVTFTAAVGNVVRDAEQDLDNELVRGLAAWNRKWLDDARYLDYTGPEWARRATFAIKNDETVFLRAIVNAAEDAGYRLQGLPLTPSEAVAILQEIAVYCDGMDADAEDWESYDTAMEAYCKRVTDGLSAYDSDGNIRAITAEPVSA